MKGSHQKPHPSFRLYRKQVIWKNTSHQDLIVSNEQTLKKRNPKRKFGKGRKKEENDTRKTMVRHRCFTNSSPGPNNTRYPFVTHDTHTHDQWKQEHGTLHEHERIESLKINSSFVFFLIRHFWPMFVCLRWNRWEIFHVELVRISFLYTRRFGFIEAWFSVIARQRNSPFSSRWMVFSFNGTQTVQLYFHPLIRLCSMDSVFGLMYFLKICSFTIDI